MSATARPGARGRDAARPVPGDPDAVAPHEASRGPASATASSRRATLVVGVLAALVAAAGSWTPALWSDEVATISAASRSLPDLLRLTSGVDAVHAAYYLVMHAWVQVAGTSAVAVRLPSALAVGVAAAGVHVLARRLGGPRPDVTAVVAAAAFALLPRVTWAGVEARPFAASIAAAVWLTVLLHVAVGGPGAEVGEAGRPRRTRRIALAGYAVLLAVGVAVNLYVALVAASHAVTLIARRRTRGAVVPFLVAAGAGLALVAPLVLTALGQGGQLGTQDLGLVRLAQNVVVNQWFLGETPTPTTADGSLEGALTPEGLWKPAALLLAAACWVLVAGVVVRALRRGAPTDARADLLAWTLPWLVLPTVAVVAGSVVSPSLYNARYFGVCAPALALLLAAGLRDLPPRRAVAVGTVLVLLAVPVVASQRTASAKSGSDWLAVVEHLDGRTAPGDGVYYGPRDPFDDGVVKRSLRALSLGYPEPFEDLVDVTLLDPPAEGRTLFGTSVPLATSLDRLEDLDTLWVLRRQDRPAQAEAEDALLAEAGFRVVDVWDGPQTQVVELRR